MHEEMLDLLLSRDDIDVNLQDKVSGTGGDQNAPQYFFLSVISHDATKGLIQSVVLATSSA